MTNKNAAETIDGALKVFCALLNFNFMKHKQKTEAIKKKTNFAITLLSPLVSYTYTHNH